MRSKQQPTRVEVEGGEWDGELTVGLIFRYIFSPQLFKIRVFLPALLSPDLVLQLCSTAHTQYAAELSIVAVDNQI